MEGEKVREGEDGGREDPVGVHNPNHSSNNEHNLTGVGDERVEEGLVV